MPLGGAQAVAMFAYGTRDCARVDLVTGPGNVYVAAAKRLLKGVIGIDSEAGPTEIGILADAGADPSYLAADLIAQAEHDENASCLLVTDASALLDAVDIEVEVQLTTTPHRERVEKALSNQSAFVLVDDLDQGLQVVDEWAAEHLEVITADAGVRAGRVRNAGAIFVGPYSPVSLGDYLAGSNHVLADRWHCSAQQRPLCPVLPARHPHRRLRPRGVSCFGSAHRRPGWRRRPRGTRCCRPSARAPGLVMALDDLPLRDDLRGQSPYGAPQLDVSVRLNTNENPYAPSSTVTSSIVARVSAAAAGLNRYPDRDSRRASPGARALRQGPHRRQVTAGQVWPANGSNEVLQQILQAFGGPGRRAIGFEPSYSMHRLICRGTGTEYLPLDRGDRFAMTGRRRARRGRRTRSRHRLPLHPQQPDGYGPAARRG